MKLILHDLTREEFERLFAPVPEDNTVVFNDGSIRPCAGCFNCWVKTPGECIIHDGYENMGALMAKSSEVMIVSRCVYGGFSPFIKNILDRSIPYIHPYFTVKNKEMHHKRRYKNRFELSVWFYGDVTEREKHTAEKLVRRNTINLNCQLKNITFLRETAELIAVSGGNYKEIGL